jgi:hypothetical protein
MGACDFTTVAWGRTPKEAFSAAVEDAQWEHGHGGYSGTIAEKHDFVLYQLPVRTKVGKVLDLMHAAEAETYLDGVRERVAWLEASLVRTASAEKPTVRKHIREAKANLKRQERDVAKFVRSAGPLLDLVRRAARTFDDKWGPAVAFEVTIASEVAVYSRYQPKPKRGYRLFVFTGLASS